MADLCWNHWRFKGGYKNPRCTYGKDFSSFDQICANKFKPALKKTLSNTETKTYCGDIRKEQEENQELVDANLDKCRADWYFVRCRGIKLTLA